MIDYFKQRIALDVQLWCDYWWLFLIVFIAFGLVLYYIGKISNEDL